MSFAREVISIMTALILTSTGLAKPSSAPAISEVLESIPMEEIVAKAEKYDITSETLAFIETANVISDVDLVVARSAELAAGASEDYVAVFGNAPVQDDESLWYCSAIPMKKEHQKLLWECCIERDLDYIDMLALISVESNFDEKATNRKYKGYFQISADYGPNLSKTLNTENKPLDGTVNIKWGTAFYSWILLDKRTEDKEGNAQKEIALSIYQQGAGGYDRKGLSKKYISKFYKKREVIASYFEAN